MEQNLVFITQLNLRSVTDGSISDWKFQYYRLFFLSNVYGATCASELKQLRKVL